MSESPVDCLFVIVQQLLAPSFIISTSRSRCRIVNLYTQWQRSVASAYHERLCDPMSTPSCWDKHEHLVSHAQANSSLQASSALLRHFWWATPFQIRARKERCSFDAKPGCPSSTTLQSAGTLFDCKKARTSSMECRKQKAHATAHGETFLMQLV